jgi:FKBP-type peptidyl-prolyl cis-trans isomerase
LNPEFWSTEPLVLKLGSDKIIKGAELSLYGCREGDVVEAFMSMDAAYGSSDVGIIPSESPVMWSYTILSVK